VSACNLMSHVCFRVEQVKHEISLMVARGSAAIFRMFFSVPCRLTRRVTS
jgi:hypothetical protein